MINRKPRYYIISKWAAALALTLLAAGCQLGAEPKSTAVAEIGQTDERNDSYLDKDTPQKTYLENKEAADPTIAELAQEYEGPETGSGAIAESNSNTPASSTKGSVQTEADEPKWNAAKPMLLGVAIGASRADIIKQFGKTDDSYLLEDGDEEIEVLEYKGFAIGMNTKKTVQYIEVYLNTVSTGLSGVRVGDKPESAVKALGKPSTENSYMITYEGKKTLLKLDLDPDHNKIVSIKLIKQP